MFRSLSGDEPRHKRMEAVAGDPPAHGNTGHGNVNWNRLDLSGQGGFSFEPTTMQNLQGRMFIDVSRRDIGKAPMELALAVGQRLIDHGD